MLLLVPALLLWLAWYLLLVRVTRLASSHVDRLVLYLAPIACLFTLAVCLPGKEAMHPGDWSASRWNCYAVGAVFLAFAALAFPWWGWGLSPRDDVAERRNRAASWAIGGALLGLTVVFAGVAEAAALTEGFSGDFLAVFFVGMLSLFVFWGILEKWACLSEAITVERDGGTAFRLSAFLPALGLLLARALPSLARGLPHLRGLPALGKEWLQLFATGEWAKHFVLLGGPVVLLLVALRIERWRKRTTPTAGCGPKADDVAIGFLYLAAAGLWTYLAR